MKKLLVTAVSAVVLLMTIWGCQKGHPMKVEIDPAFEEGGSDKIAVFPFLSAIHEADDPDHLAPQIMEQYFAPALDARNDYTFISAGTVRYTIEGEGWENQYEKFLEDYPRTGKTDPEFLDGLATLLNADAFLIPVVDVWQKDEADYQENTTPATYVGATITVVDRTGENVLFLASDEDYLEGARTETGDRGLVSTGGRVRSDSGAKTHRAPPFDEVAIKVINALVESMPVR
jgi:hypothetical protein